MLVRRSSRRGYKLIELIVIVSLLGVVLGLAVLAGVAARDAGRKTQCANNMRQLGLSLLNFTSSKNHFPNAGTFHDDPAIHQGDPAKSSIARSLLAPQQFATNPDPWRWNWIVNILPYLDSQDLSNGWDFSQPYLSSVSTISGQRPNLTISNTPLGVFRCPADPTTVDGQGNLSYVVNGGFSRWLALPVGWEGGKTDGEPKNGGVLRWVPPDRDWRENQDVSRRLGVMFLGTTTGDQPWDVVTSTKDIADGASMTLLLGENTLAGYSAGTPYSGGVQTNWACPLPNFCMFIGSDDVCRTAGSSTDCLAGSLKPASGGNGPGWAFANRPGTYENIGYGRNLTVEGSFPYAGSGHKDGGNFVFCDGATRFISNSIDGTVYARLITPAGTLLPSAVRQTGFGPDALNLDD